jgi:hypothetical protein
MNIRIVSVALLLAAASACNKDRTEIILGMATDLRAPAPLASVEVQIFDISDPASTRTLYDIPFDITGTPAQSYNLPATFAVYSANGSADRFRAVLTASDTQGTPLVVRTAVMSLVPEKTLFVRLGLVGACQGMDTCGTGQTCVDGACATEDIDSSLLPEYVTGVESEIQCASDTNFIDTSTGQPLKVTGTACGAGSCRSRHQDSRRCRRCR